MLTWADLIADLGFVLAVDNCARGCLHCPAFGSTVPVQRAGYALLAARVASISHSRARLGLGHPQRVVHCWRISDPLDYAVRTADGTVASCAELAGLWREHFGQGLYMVTNGSEGRQQARKALQHLSSQPQLVSQIKITITPADVAWGTSRYETDLANDLATLAPLWDLPSTRAEDPAGRRLRINVKASAVQMADASLAVARMLKAAGLDPRIADDSSRVAFKPIYDLGNALGTASPVPAAVTIDTGGDRFKPTPETRTRHQYGIRPDGRLFQVDMYAFTERDLTSDNGEPLCWPETIPDLEAAVTA